MSRLSKQDRRHIVEEFARRHNGQYNPMLFLEEVRKTGSEHPAYEWFEWDLKKAARAYQIEQARQFARDLRVSFTVEDVSPKRKVKVAHQEMPLVISPIEGRRHGGGYVLVDPEDPEHMQEHCRQAAMALGSWLKRYGSALEFAGRRKAEVESVIRTLENAQMLVRETA